LLFTAIGSYWKQVYFKTSIIHIARFDVFTALLLTIQNFWDVEC